MAYVDVQSYVGIAHLLKIIGQHVSDELLFIFVDRIANEYRTTVS